MSLSESFSQLTKLLDSLEKQKPLFEGGNMFKDQEGNILTQRIDQKDVLETVRWLEGITGLDLGGKPTSKVKKERGVPVIWLGSTGRTPTSGDLDFAILDATKEQVQQKLVSFLNQNNLEPAKEWIRAVKQNEINFRAPIKGDPSRGFVQVDFNFYDDPDRAEWAKFYMGGTSAGFKGMHRNVLLSSLARAHPGSNAHPDGIKIGANGMLDRRTNELVQGGRNPDEVAKKLLGPDYNRRHLRTVEDIYAALGNDPKKDEKLEDFRGFLEKKGIKEPKIEEPVSEDSSHFLARLRDRIVNQGMEIIIESERKDPRIPHPEDAFLTDGVAAADKAISQLESAVQNANKVTIKWDGKPALIWGRLPNGRIAVMDKYMFDAGFAAQSPKDWLKYDQQKASGRTRDSLYPQLAAIWPGLEAATKGSGFFWGDLMWAGKLSPQGGVYRFKPNTVEYAIPEKSDLGKMISDKTGGIVVHQKFNNLGDKSAQVWDGEGLENVPGGMAIISPNVGISFSLQLPGNLLNKAKATVNKYRQPVDQLIESVPASVRARIKTYFNQSIVGNTNEPLHEWLKQGTSAKQYAALVTGRPNEEGKYNQATDNLPGLLFTLDGANNVKPSPAYIGLTEIWNSIYRLKLNLAQQLESQVEGLSQSTAGKAEGEGFVVPTPDGLVKLVNRGLFSAQNVKKNN